MLRRMRSFMVNKKRFVLKFKVMETPTRVKCILQRGEVYANSLEEATMLFFPKGNTDDRYFVVEG